MDINLKGYLFTAQLAAKQMIRQRQEEPEGIRPVIINMSSISAYTLSLMSEFKVGNSHTGCGAVTELCVRRHCGH